MDWDNFWDKTKKYSKEFAKELPKKLGEQINRVSEEVNSAKERFESMSNDELLRIVNNGGSQIERKVAFSILKSRGVEAE